MKIVIIGGNGTIGNMVVSHFNKENNVLIAGRPSGNVTVDITDSRFYQRNEFKNVGELNFLVNGNESENIVFS